MLLFSDRDVQPADKIRYLWQNIRISMYVLVVCHLLSCRRNHYHFLSPFSAVAALYFLYNLLQYVNLNLVSASTYRVFLTTKVSGPARPLITRP